MTYTVFRSIDINGQLYYEYGPKDMDSHVLTLRKDHLSRILARINNHDYVYFDFSLKNGDTYYFSFDPGSAGNLFTVTVKKNITVDTPAGKFDHCIELFFDIPEAIDEEHGYVFTPGIGIVKFIGTWRTRVLWEYNLVQ